MPTPLIRYALDPTGINPDNLVLSEPVVLENRRIRAIAPKEGAFYGASLVIKENSTGRTLTPGVHYSPAEYFRTPSEMYGKRVFGIILVNDPAVSSNLTIDYQVVGGEYIGQTDTLKHLLEQYRHDGTEYSFYDVVGKPEAFDPTPHYHSLDDGMNFQYMVYALERIRNAILWADSPAIQDIYTYIETLLADLDEKLKHKVDSIMSPLLYEFKRTITKATIGLDKVENLRVATIPEGTKAGLQETKIQDFLERKYVALDTIVAFKDSLYTSLVSKETTNLGRTAATFVPPRKARLFALPNGAVVTFLSRREALASVDGFEASCYPPGISDDQRVTIVKVINNRNNNGGVFLAYLMDGTKAFIGQHDSGNVIEDFVWKRFLFSEDLKIFTDLLAAHITNTNNPHKVRKDQVGLSEVENLPVITREEILCLKSVRKYMTFDAFLLFMKAFMIGKNGSAADPGDESGEPLENCQIIYCPCSPCGCGPTSSAPPVSYPPAGQLISWSCRGYDKWGIYHNGAGGTYDQIMANNSPDCGWTPPATPPPADVLLGFTCEGTTKIGRYSDGKGGTYNNVIETNSADCAGTPPSPTPTPTPPPAGDPSITLTFAASSVRVGASNKVGFTAVARNLVSGKKYSVSYKMKYGDNPIYPVPGSSQDFTATSTEQTYNEFFTNEGDAFSGRLTLTAVLTDITSTRQIESAPAYTNLVVDKAIDLTINGSRTGGDIAAGSSVNIVGLFKDWPINKNISYTYYVYDTAGDVRQVSMNQLGAGSDSVSGPLVSADTRGQQRYKLVGRWTVPTQAGGGVREVASNIVTINWTGPVTNHPPPGQEISRTCNGPNMVGTFANGSGGTYQQVIQYNSPQCVVTPPPPPPPSPTPPPPPPPPPPPTGPQPITKTIPWYEGFQDNPSNLWQRGTLTMTWDPAGGANTVTVANAYSTMINYATFEFGNPDITIRGGGNTSNALKIGSAPANGGALKYYFISQATVMASDFRIVALRGPVENAGQP